MKDHPTSWRQEGGMITCLVLTMSTEDQFWSPPAPSSPADQLRGPPPLPGGNITPGNNTASIDRLYQHTGYNDNANKGNSSCSPSLSAADYSSPETHRSFNHTQRAADSRKEGKQELARTKYAADDYCPAFENNGWADGGVMDEWING